MLVFRSRVFAFAIHVHIPIIVFWLKHQLYYILTGAKVHELIIVNEQTVATWYNRVIGCTNDWINYSQKSTKQKACKGFSASFRASLPI